ncbi:MAG: serine/threonine protein kinase-related protein [Planctomycetota bacterium]|nr:MAG: serine/threonine protein kinase-related protein [Planctomycetota bacterium]
MANFLKNLFDKKSRVEKVDVARRFELLARVGQGSMSKVWRARDNMTGRMLAVKVLDKMKTERFEARFVGLKKPSEGDVAATLQHPNIVHTIEHGITTNDEQYLVMDFVEGLSLSYLVDTQNEQMRDNCLNYVIQLGEAIDYLHRQNWIHRDLCPRNVMVDPDNTIKLIDFGLVVPNTPDFQKPGNRTGTANYMAPELIKRQRTDQRIDIFSFAVTAYEMFAKRLPWDVLEQETLETVLQHINKPPKPITDFASHIDSRVAEVIMKGLETNPDHRWQTMSELLIPLRKAHEEIEAKQQLQRKLKAATAKAKAAKAGASPAAVAAKKQKAKDDDDFFEQVLFGEATPKKDVSQTKPATPPQDNREKSSPEKWKPTPAKSPIPKSSSAKSSSVSPKAVKPVPPAAKSPPKPPEPDIVVEDEFDGIEIEEEGHKLDGIEAKEGSSDEFDGIEIEIEGELPVEPISPPQPPLERKRTALLLDESPAATSTSTAAALADDDDDEPVLRLPDDD